jgi:formate dehydrogenase
VRDAGFGTGPEAGERLFDAILSGPHGVVITEDRWDRVWQRVRDPESRIRLAIPELLADLTALTERPSPDPDPSWPFILTAGERRAFTANTIIRDPGWRRRGGNGALHMSLTDAERMLLSPGDRVRVTTPAGSSEIPVEPTDRMQPGHVSLPNGLGLASSDPQGDTGAPPNELTSATHRDPWVGTPMHKYIPARVERCEVTVPRP